MSPAISVNKECGSIKPSDTEDSPCPHARVHPEGIQDGENKVLVLESLGTYQRNDFNEPRLLHLPVHRKTLKFLNLRYLVFFH